MSSNPNNPNANRRSQPQQRPPTSWTQPPPPNPGGGGYYNNPPPTAATSSSLPKGTTPNPTNPNAPYQQQPPPPPPYQQPYPPQHPYAAAPHMMHQYQGKQYHSHYYATHQAQETAPPSYSHSPYQPPVPPQRQPPPPPQPFNRVGMWQPNYGHHPAPPQQGYAAGFVPQQQAQQPMTREKKILTITDKDGKAIDLTKKKSQQHQPENTPGSMMKALAAQALAGNVSTRKMRDEEERKKKEEVERKKREEEERIRKRKEEEEEDRKRKEEEERNRKAEEERIRKHKEEEERKKKEEEERKRKEEEERIKREEEERIRKFKQEEERKKREEEERIRKQKEEEARKRREEERVRLVKERAEKEKLAAGKASSQPRPTPYLGPSSRSSPSLRPGASASPSLRPGSSTSASFRSSAPTSFRPGGEGSLRPGGGGGLRPGGGKKPIVPPIGFPSASPTPNINISNKRRVYTKNDLLAFRDLSICISRPSDLPDLTIRPNVNRPRQTGKGDQWARGSTPRRYENQQWNRGQQPPPQKERRGNSRRTSKQDLQAYDGPPLKKSENRWMPTKSTSTLETSQKLVKSILNKMTKEKFVKLSNQMCDIPIISYEMLTMMIHSVYEKAIDEPAFAEMYADLCVRLAQKTSSSKFIHVIDSDEEPDDGFSEDGRSWRWSNDVSVDDDEVVGPCGSVDDCLDIALSEDSEMEPVKRGDMVLELDSLRIMEDVFIKILKTKEEEGEEPKYFMVYFAVDEAKECGQHLSKVFSSEEKCKSDAAKQNSFKRTLLNKCEDEFNKQDIYVDWKKEKKEYDKIKATLKEEEREVKEEELDFRRIKIKKQMLGNIKFIGELYKKGLIRENIMHYCIHSLMKLRQNKEGKLVNIEDDEMDAEDHEALCQLFTTIGKNIDKDKNRKEMKVYFEKMKALSNDKTLNSRSRFMYKDLMDLRANKWKLRREQETAKTLNEIRKDAAREERHQQDSGYRGGGGGGRGGDRDRTRGGPGPSYGSGTSRRNIQKPVESPDGFTPVSKGKGSFRGPMATSAPPVVGFRTTAPIIKSPPPPVSNLPVSNLPVSNPSTGSGGATPSPLSEEKLKLRIKNMTNEYIQDRNNLDELLYSMESISGTPNAGQTVAQITGDRVLDCKDSERDAIISMFVTLIQKEKLTFSDLDVPLSELIEFIDSFVLDSPRAIHYLGELLSALFHIKALNVSWLCKACGKLVNDSDKEKVIRHTIQAMKKTYGMEDVKACFYDASQESNLINLLGAEQWNAIKSQ